MSRKAEMKRKLATVTPEIYNGLDLIVDSPEFNQVGSRLNVSIAGNNSVALRHVVLFLWVGAGFRHQQHIRHVVLCYVVFCYVYVKSNLEG